MDDGPIFLAGLDRSGIGLLGEVLESHPDVSITRRLNFWDFYADRYGNLEDPRNLERCLEAMMGYSRIRRLDPDPEALRKEFERGDRTYPRLLRLLQEQNMRRLGKTRWGDKTLGAEAHAPRILAEFPHATILHVVRDPRDRYASQATHRSPGRGGVGSGTAAWLWSARLARRYAQAHPGRYLPVRYEDLVIHPEVTVRSICSFVGIDYHDSMLSPPDAGPLHRKSVGRYRRDLDPGEVRFIERTADGEMSRWGYRVEPTRGATRDRLRFAATGLPVAAAGLVLWRPWSAAKRLLTTGPSPRRRVRTPAF